jgi:hypothetical protein
MLIKLQCNRHAAHFDGITSPWYVCCGQYTQDDTLTVIELHISQVSSRGMLNVGGDAAVMQFHLLDLSKKEKRMREQWSLQNIP